MTVSTLWTNLHLESLSAALAVLTSMITPALLISASGTFILSTSNRLGRVVDRVRVLSEKIEDLMHHEADFELLEDRRSMMLAQMGWLSRRAIILQQSLTIFYLAAGIFVATSVAIGVASLVSANIGWLPVVLGILGACFLFYGSVKLILEARIAVESLHAETGFLDKLVRLHTPGAVSPVVRREE